MVRVQVSTVVAVVSMPSACGAVLGPKRCPERARRFPGVHAGAPDQLRIAVPFEFAKMDGAAPTSVAVAALLRMR